MHSHLNARPDQDDFLCAWYPEGKPRKGRSQGQNHNDATCPVCPVACPAVQNDPPTTRDSSGSEPRNGRCAALNRPRLECKPRDRDHGRGHATESDPERQHCGQCLVRSFQRTDFFASSSTSTVTATTTTAPADCGLGCRAGPEVHDCGSRYSWSSSEQDVLIARQCRNHSPAHRPAAAADHAGRPSAVCCHSQGNHLPERRTEDLSPPMRSRHARPGKSGSGSRRRRESVTPRRESHSHSHSHLQAQSKRREPAYTDTSARPTACAAHPKQCHCPPPERVESRSPRAVRDSRARSAIDGGRDSSVRKSENRSLQSWDQTSLGCNCEACRMDAYS